MKRHALLLPVAAVGLAAGMALAAPLTLDGGKLEGVATGGVLAYRGIPYAPHLR